MDFVTISIDLEHESSNKTTLLGDSTKLIDLDC